jgi:hypothetical protein
MIHVFKGAVGEGMVEAAVIFGDIVGRGDMRCPVYPARQPMVYSFGTDIDTNDVIRVRPNQAKISTITATKIKNSPVKTESLVGGIFP